MKHLKVKTLALILVGLLIAAGIPTMIAAQEGAWVERQSTYTAGGVGEAVVGVGDHVYAMRCASTGTSCYFWKYDTAGDDWTELKKWKDLPDSDLARCKSGTNLAWDHGDYIYALFGAAYSDANRTYFYRYTISTNSWEQLADTPHAQGAGNAITWSGHDGRIYAMLGSREHGTDFARYDPSGNSWEILPFNLWTCTDDGAALARTGGEYLYALRGEWEEIIPHDDFARYHISTAMWQDMAPIPEDECGPGNSGSGCGVGDGASLIWVGDEYPNHIFALGGGGVLEELGYNFYRYSLSGDSWETLEQIPCPVGYWVGNRFGFASGHIYYWQGAPTTKPCGGDGFYRFRGIVEPIGGATYPNDPTHLLAPWMGLVALVALACFVLVLTTPLLQVWGVVRLLSILRRLRLLTAPPQAGHRASPGESGPTCTNCPSTFASIMIDLDAVCLEVEGTIRSQNGVSDRSL